LKSRFIWATLCILVLLSLVAASCSNTTTSTSSATTTTSSAAITTQPQPTTSITSANWWDKFGEPQYGGTINFCYGMLMGTSFDLYTYFGGELDLWYEALFTPRWTADRQEWPMTTSYYPDKYWTGNLAESWEMTDATTITAHLRQGVKWQNKAPVNGRELVASDVEAHYDRLMGTGGGYTALDPLYAGNIGNLVKVTAADKYTVTFKFKKASAQNFQTIADNFALNEIDAPEWVALGGPPGSAPAGGPPAGGSGAPPAGGSGAPPAGGANSTSPLADWTKVVGTGPWMLTDLVSGSSFTFSKNPDYWGTDPRFPQNKIPYADTLKMKVIPDASTQLAALRTGQIDVLGFGMTSIGWQQAKELNKTNPEILQQGIPGNTACVAFMVNVEPFTDIRVRQALNMAIDREAMAKGYYGGTANSDPVGIITPAFKGYAYTYDEWSQSLKDQYAYNPTAAKQLLADAGYPNGFETSVIVQSNPTSTALMELYKAYFADIGVNMDIRSIDMATYEATRRTGKVEQMSYEPCAVNSSPAKASDIYYSKGGGNAVFYGLDKSPDAVYDALHDELFSTADATAAMQIFQKMDKQVLEQHFQVPAPEAYTFNVWLPTLKGYSGEGVMWGQGLLFSRLWTTK